MNLNKNQIHAIQTSIENDFQSGIHFHATGTGKSWIGLELIMAFQQKYKNLQKIPNIFWICERKSILIEQFSNKLLKERGFENVLKEFHILNFSSHKQQDWFNSVNSTRYWNKPSLTIINRSFLTSNDKFKKININIDLIIHDECHTIVNKSTRDFYEFILERFKNIKIIGLSATPNTNFQPFNNILTTYSIYNAFMDDVIVQPVIHWFKSDTNITQETIILNVKSLIDKMPYKKVIIWCGMIKSCLEYAQLWSKYFNEYLVSIDTSMENNEEINKFHNFEEFERCDSNALLFCAGKHREGSDIKNLDCAIFLDFVQNRYCKTFVQCIGRVLRKDKQNIKKCGLIIDIKAKSSTKIIDKMNEYLDIPKYIFPWSYDCEKSILSDKLNIYTLKLLKENNNENNNEYIENNKNENDYTITDLYNSIIRPIPQEQIYKDRLTHEINMIASKNLIGYIMRALEILKMTKHIPHVTRGSCGSSLLCYLVGISHVDPIKYNIKFSRFLNIYRNNLPDIDFDFPYNMRDEVFLKLQMKWPGKIARISNHVYYHEKSAKREGLRSIGINGFISKYDIHDVIKNLDKKQKKQFDINVNKLDGTFRCYSLHCGGIVYYPEGVPEELKLKQLHDDINKNGLSQIVLNKHDVSNNNQFKIDILSSRALAQLYQTLDFESIDFEKHYEDTKTKELLMSGNNIGLTFAESPLIRKSFMKIKPKTVDEIAICLSIIRPAAKDARDFNDVEDLEGMFVYDDDAIDILSKSLGCTEDLADKYRRAFTKDDKDEIAQVAIDLSMENEQLKIDVLNKLKNLRKYSFCKSHAYSYAQLVWQLAYTKAHYPEEFWKSTLNHCESSYKKWVHYYEARCVGIDYHHILMNKEDVSVYSKNRMKKFFTLTPIEQLRTYGYWDMKSDKFFPGCYYFKNDNNYVIKGIIASSRMLSKGKKKCLVLFIGYNKGNYCEMTINNPNGFNGKIIGVKSTCKCTDKIQQCYESIHCEFF